MIRPSISIVPPAVTPGSRIRVVAPSGPFDRALALRGIAFLSKRYRVEFDWSMFERHQMFAGTDERRLAELNSALTDPGVAAIVAARGGYGLTRILPDAQLAALREQPRWFVGFSDATALHVEATRLHVASLHAPNLTGLGRGDRVTRSEWIAALEQPLAQRIFPGLDGWHPGHGSGLLVGGNLTMLFVCAAAGRLRLPDGAVLLLEDVTEHSYRIDRMLTALLCARALDRVNAIIVGDFTDCPTGVSGVAAHQVVRERLSRLNVPVVAGFPCGHTPRNVPVPLGCPAVVDADSGRVVINP